MLHQKGAFSFDTHYRTLWWGVSKCAPRCEVTAGKDRQPFQALASRRGFCILVAQISAADGDPLATDKKKPAPELAIKIGSNVM